MVGRGDDDGVDVLALKHVAIVAIGLDAAAGRLGGGFQTTLVNVADCGDGHLAFPAKLHHVVQMDGAHAADADHADDEPFIRPRNAATRERDGRNDPRNGNGRCRAGKLPPREIESAAHRDSPVVALTSRPGRSIPAREGALRCRTRSAGHSRPRAVITRAAPPVNQRQTETAVKKYRAKPSRHSLSRSRVFLRPSDRRTTVLVVKEVKG